MKRTSFRPKIGAYNRTEYLKRPIKPVAKRKTSKLPKPRVWSTNRADKEFSLYIRNRDGKCLFPGCDIMDIKKLQCSHYIERRHSSTRYDPDNCISLCWKHHFKDKLIGFEYQKQIKSRHGYDGQYTKFMQDFLGMEEFEKLLLRGWETMQRSGAILVLMALLAERDGMV